MNVILTLFDRNTQTNILIAMSQSEMIGKASLDGKMTRLASFRDKTMLYKPSVLRKNVTKFFWFERNCVRATLPTTLRAYHRAYEYTMACLLP